MTFSNRIPFAGVIPLLVVAALAVLAAIVVLTPGQPAKAATTNDACTKLSPVIWDMLKSHYVGLDDFECNTFEPNASAPNADTENGANAAIWDFSDQELTSFAISDDDATILRTLFNTVQGAEVDEDTADITPEAVRYIDLTNNPLSVADVDFKHIPQDVAIILSADSPVMGFQASSYEITEGEIGYVGFALPGTAEADDTDADSEINVTITIGGSQADDELNSAIVATDGTPNNNYGALVGLGGDAVAATDGLVRPVALLNDGDDVVYYFPISAKKDNENDGWEVEFSVTTADDSNVTVRELDETAILVADADTPATEVCDRTDDVLASIMREVNTPTSPATAATYGGTADRSRRCQELTLRDLGAINGTLHIVDEDTETIALDTATFTNGEPLESLVAGDFEGLTGVDRLQLIGARSLPSGIFAGVGGDSDVVIHFSANSHEDDEVEEVGNFKPSTIPSHIWDDQEKNQIIVLADDVDDDDKGVTKGFDADLYAGNEGDPIFVLTNAATASYVLGNSVNFGELRPAGADAVIMTAGVPEPVADVLDLQGDGEANSKVVRFAITLPDVDEDTNMWLFLFDTTRATGDDPGNASVLRDLASVAIVFVD